MAYAIFSTGHKSGPGRPASVITEAEQKILEVLRQGSPTHGTEIARRAHIPTGGIYSLLRRLESKKLVERIETEVDFGETHLRRVVYRIPST